MIEQNETATSARLPISWCPDECPITGRKFFMWIDHPKDGIVPTYGGPFDSYTLAKPDGEGTFECERYDHDAGHWRDDASETIDLRLIDGQADECEHGEVERLINQRDAILLQARVWSGEAKTQQAITREVGEILGGIPSWGPIAAGVEALRQRVAALELMREHRIAVTPEHEGQWHAALYGHEAEPLARAEGDKPEAAVDAVIATYRAQQGGGHDRE